MTLNRETVQVTQVNYQCVCVCQLLSHVRLFVTPWLHSFSRITTVFQGFFLTLHNLLANHIYLSKYVRKELKCEKTLNSVCSSCSHPRQMLQPHIQVQYSRYKLKGCFYFMPCLLPKYRPKLRMEMFQNQVRATMQMQSLLLWVSSHSSSHSISFLPPSLLCTKSALYKSCEMLKNICCTYEH